MNKSSPRRSRPSGWAVVVLPMALLVAALLALNPATPSSAAAQMTGTFAIIGDFGDAGTPLADVATLIDSWTPDYIVTVGDNDYGAGTLASLDENVGQYFSNYIFPYSGSYGSTATSNMFWPALGNHDWDPLSCSGTCTGPYLDYFTLPNNERYYDIKRGDVHLFIVDSDTREPDGTSAASIQGLWLQGALSASNSLWKIVIFHHAPYASSSGPNDAYMRWPFATWGASAVVYGHHHFYERLEVDGIPYIVNGVGGRSLAGFGTTIPESIVRYNSDYGAIKVTQTVTELTLTFINRAGTTIDSVTIERLPTAVTLLPIIANPPVSEVETAVPLLFFATLAALSHRRTLFQR